MIEFVTGLLTHTLIALVSGLAMLYYAHREPGKFSELVQAFFGD